MELELSPIGERALRTSHRHSPPRLVKSPVEQRESASWPSQPITQQRTPLQQRIGGERAAESRPGRRRARRAARPPQRGTQKCSRRNRRWAESRRGRAFACAASHVALRRALLRSAQPAAQQAMAGLSPCDVAALQKCLKENDGDHKKVGARAQQAALLPGPAALAPPGALALRLLQPIRGWLQLQPPPCTPPCSPSGLISTACCPPAV